MKRLVSIFLLLCMVLGLCACGEKEPTVETVQTSTEEFSVGFARVDITPQISVPMAGFGRTSQRMSRNIRDNLYASAIAMCDGEGDTVLFLSMDLQRASDITVQVIRPLVSAETGIPQDHILLHGTHTHSGPDLHNSNHPAIVSYIEYLNPRLVQVCLDALNNMKPAQMYYGSAETEGLNFVKHYQHTTADGEVKYFGDNFGTQVLDSTTKHTTEADPTIWLLKFTREGEKDLIIANWRAHPTLTGAFTKYDLSADYPGTFRLAMESQLDCNFVYFNGAAGNLNAKSRISSEMAAADVDQHGALMAEVSIEALKNMTKAQGTNIQLKQNVLDMDCNHTTDNLVIMAKQVQALWNQGASFSEAVEIGLPYGIRSPYFASAIISRSTRPDTMDVELDTVTIGTDVAICTAPNELFDTNTMFVEENSPYAMTMTFGYSNGYRGYIPSAYGWEYTSYESDCSYFLPGCGETIQDTFLSMLEELSAE